MDFGRRTKEVVIRKSKQTRKAFKQRNFTHVPETVSNIKVEELDKSLAFQCTLCNKTFKSAAPLGYHYCKHFSKDLQDLDISDLVQDEKCLKCERKFFDKNAMLSHVGVKHGLINDILEAKGLPQLQLDDENPSSSVNIKTEREDDSLERSCEICVQDFSTVPISSLAYHYCNHFSAKIGTFFSRYYTDKTCNICKKNFKTINSLMVHIGVRHGKINSILNSEQLKPLRFPKKKKPSSTVKDSSKSSIFAKEKVLDALREPKLETGSKNVISEQKLQISREKLEAKTCFICDKTSGNKGNLKHHIASHFWNELKNISSDLVTNGKTCGICNETSQTVTTLIKHIAITHGKLDEILESRGYPTLNLRKKSSKEASESKVPRKYSTSDIKEIRECEICNKEFETVSKLGQHMVTGHFMKEIRETYRELYNGKECLLCNNTYARNVFIMHIGATHNKLDEVLAKNGYRPLKAKIVPNLKKIHIKKERPDADEVTNEYSSLKENAQELSNEGNSLAEESHRDQIELSTDDSQAEEGLGNTF